MSSIKHKESGVINQRKSLGLAEVSRKINKPPVKADKILGLAKKINMIPRVTDINTASISTVPDVINVPDRTTEDVSNINIIVTDTTEVSTVSSWLTKLLIFQLWQIDIREHAAYRAVVDIYAVPEVITAGSVGLMIIDRTDMYRWAYTGHFILTPCNGMRGTHWSLGLPSWISMVPHYKVGSRHTSPTLRKA